MAPSVLRGGALRREAEAIWSAALRAVNPSRLIEEHVQRSGDRLAIKGRTMALSSFDRIFLAALGKAARPMAEGLVPILGDRLERGVVLCPADRLWTHPRILSLPGSHPLPDRKSLKAAREIMRLARQAGPGDLFIVLLSGGASSQACLPARGLKLGEKRLITRRLLRAGADVSELNAVRKHLSLFKGGRLALAAYPAAVLNLVLSDVRHNDLETIGSGPTFWDSRTYAGARRVLEKYGLWKRAPAGVRAVIEDGRRRKIPETPKPHSPAFRRVESIILGDIKTALQAAAERARRLGFEARLLSSADHGEARDAARRYASVLRRAMARDLGPGRRLCFLAGGELTVSVRGRGKGGRNSEFVLAALAEMSSQSKAAPVRVSPGRPAWLVASLGTDGLDGPTDAAGAWASAEVAAAARRLELDPLAYLRRNDSYSFFQRTGSLVRTGPTGTNVMDLRILLVG